MRTMTKRTREARTTGKENLWILQLLDNPIIAADLNYSADYLMAGLLGKVYAWLARVLSFCVGKIVAPSWSD